MQVLQVVESIKSGVEWFQNNPLPDLIFSDIQIADGLSFSIFEQINIPIPIIFVTAYDQYALKAFKLNSIDYILKPIERESLRFSLAKYYSHNLLSGSTLQEMIKTNLFATRQYRRSFLINYQNRLIPLHIDSVAYFYINEGVVYVQLADGKKYLLDLSLDELQDQLDPDVFFRVNRQFIVSKTAVKELWSHYNSRLRLQLKPVGPESVVISKERVSNFKKWFEAFE